MDIVSCVIKWRGQVLCQKDPFVYLSGLTYQLPSCFSCHYGQSILICIHNVSSQGRGLRLD